MTLGESVLLARTHALMLSIYLPETHQLTVCTFCLHSALLHFAIGI
jgi:hypothetical protein